MKVQSLLLGLACLAIGAGIAWFAKPTSAPAGSPASTQIESNTQPPVKGSSPSPSDQSQASKKDFLKPDFSRGKDGRINEEAKREAQFEKRMKSDRERQRAAAIKKIEERVNAWVADLGLSAAEGEMLRQQLMADLDERGKLNQKLSKGEINEEGLIELARLIQPSQVNDRLAALLEGDSRERFLAEAARERTKTIEADSLVELATLQRALDLTEEQKDAVYSRLYEQRSAEYDDLNPKAGLRAALEESVGTIGSALMSDAMLDLSVDMMQQGLKKAEAEPADVQAGMKSSIQRNIDNTVSRFDGILSPDQQATYRKQLEEQFRPFTSGAFGGAIEE